MIFVQWRVDGTSFGSGESTDAGREIPPRKS
jgi:hypothetical protein